MTAIYSLWMANDNGIATFVALCIGAEVQSFLLQPFVSILTSIHKSINMWSGMGIGHSWYWSDSSDLALSSSPSKIENRLQWESHADFIGRSVAMPSIVSINTHRFIYWTFTNVNEWFYACSTCSNCVDVRFAMHFVLVYLHTNAVWECVHCAAVFIHSSMPTDNVTKVLMAGQWAHIPTDPFWQFSLFCTSLRWS